MSTPSLDDDSPDYNAMGFPLISFALIWPIVKMLAIPLIRAILPWLLRRIADSFDTLTDSEIEAAVSQQESTMRSAYRG